MRSERSDDLVLASPMRRLVAWLVDALATCGAAVAGNIAESSSRDFWYTVALLLMLLGGQLYALAAHSQTLGMRLCGARVMKLDHTPAGIARIVLIRMPTQVLLSSLLVLDVLVMSLRADRRSLCDLIAGTFVAKSRHAPQTRARRAPPPRPPAHRTELWRLAPTLLMVFVVALVLGHLQQRELPEGEFPGGDACS